MQQTFTTPVQFAQLWKMTLKEKSSVNSKQNSGLTFPVWIHFHAVFSFASSARLSILTHSSWRDLRMAGMLVAEGAFGRIGCDTTKDSEVAHIENKLSVSLITLVLYIDSKCTWFRMGGHIALAETFFIYNNLHWPSSINNRFWNTNG